MLDHRPLSEKKIAQSPAWRYCCHIGFLCYQYIQQVGSYNAGISGVLILVDEQKRKKSCYASGYGSWSHLFYSESSGRKY